MVQSGAAEGARAPSNQAQRIGMHFAVPLYDAVIDLILQVLHFLSEGVIPVKSAESVGLVETLALVLEMRAMLRMRHDVIVACV
jgi:hypothetical protein